MFESQVRDNEESLVSDLQFEVAPDAERNAQAAAAFVAQSARAAVDARGAFTVAFSGGSTPVRMLELLGEVSVPWDRVHVFQVDERVAPDGDPARNLNMLKTGLLLPGRLPPANLHPMPVLGDDLDAAARDYANELRACCGAGARLDLIHLGLGDDGHTASLVPGDDALSVTDRDVAMTSDYRGHRRMTLTYPALDRAVSRLWLANGADKGPMLNRLRDADASIPAGRVVREQSVVFCDQAAATAMS
ncbi:MAG: 6-phosphogluconolactonase [Gammaproteobacteria bacterium]